MLSFHRCIVPTDEFADDTYLNNLELRTSQKELLRNARRLVREALRAAFKKETAAFFGEEKPISPNFFTQGSWGYKTINRPTHCPPQQTDMDDGCYLPMTFVRGQNPKRAATWFFDVADKALDALVAQQGWERCDSSKETCCRVIIDGENHVDVPLYAIRDEQFLVMKRSLTEDRAGVFREAVAAVSEEDEYTFDWSMVTEEDVLLAKRNGVWEPSNPMDVMGWARSAVEQAGSQLRDTWRAIKGWRDQVFPNGGGPSSISLMVMVEADFEGIEGRADLALRAAAKSVRERITGSIEAPWDKREDLNRLSPSERVLVAQKAKELEEELDYCFQGTLGNVAQYLQRLRTHCGKHFSEDKSRVKEISPHEVVHAYSAAPAVIPPFRGDNRSA